MWSPLWWARPEPWSTLRHALRSAPHLPTPHSSRSSVVVAKDRLGGLFGLLRHGPVRYLLVGGCLVAFDTTVFMALVYLGVAPAIAQLVSRTAGGIGAFILHRTVTFPSDEHELGGAAQGASFVVFHIWNLAISPLVVVASIWVLGGWIFAGKLMADLLLALQNYVLVRWTFRPPASDASR